MKQNPSVFGLLYIIKQFVLGLFLAAVSSHYVLSLFLSRERMLRCKSKLCIVLCCFFIETFLLCCVLWVCRAPGQVFHHRHSASISSIPSVWGNIVKQSSCSPLLKLFRLFFVIYFLFVLRFNHRQDTSLSSKAIQLHQVSIALTQRLICLLCWQLHCCGRDCRGVVLSTDPPMDLWVCSRCAVCIIQPQIFAPTPRSQVILNSNCTQTLFLPPSWIQYLRSLRYFGRQLVSDLLTSAASAAIWQHFRTAGWPAVVA